MRCVFYPATTLLRGTIIARDHLRCTLYDLHPITLRLPTDLLSELDEEADEAGFSSRSEYIRHLLQNRKDTSELFSSEDSGSSEHDSSTEIVDTVEELDSDLAEMGGRVDDLEQTIEQIQAQLNQIPDTQETATPDEELTAEDVSQAHDLDALNDWLQTDGPDSDNAQAVMRDAARILSDQGPLSASKLRKQLFERHPDAYSSADTLWKSTVQRLYDEAPGFSKPKYGIYDFN